MGKLPLAARIYVLMTVALGAVLLALLLQVPTLEQLPTFVGLSLASIGTSMLKLRLPTTKNRSTMSVSCVANFNSMLLLGPHQAMGVTAGGADGSPTNTTRQ